MKIHVKSNPGNSSGYGICLTIRYYSSEIGNFCVIFAHMNSYDTSLKIGSIVKKGQQIGRIGNTGNSNGPHLHYQVFYGSKYSDLINSFNPFQILYPVENKAKSISEKYGLKFYDSGGYKVENAFYSAYANDKNKYSAYYNENQKLGVLLETFFN